MPVMTLPYNPVTGGGAFAYDAGVLSHLVGATQTALGQTRGGLEFNPGMETRQPEYDGKRHDYAGGDRVVGYASEFSGTIITLTDAILPLILSGGAAVGGIYTPPTAGVSIAKTAIIKLPRLELMRSDNTGIYVEFDYGMVTEWSVSTTDKEEAEIELTIKARVDPAATGYTTNSPDFRIGPLTAPV